MERVWPGDRLDLGESRPKSVVASGYTRFESGDVLVPKITPTFEAGRSVLVPALPRSVGVGTTELHVVRAGEAIDRRYLLYHFLTHRFLKIGESEMYGVAGQKRVPDDLLRDWEVDLPPLDEQRRIADFLDDETSEIDEIIEAREKQLKLIGERDAAATIDAVRGATLGVTMRESGLDWLGDVAEGFRIAAVSHEFDVSLGKMLNPARTQGEHLRPYLRNTNVQWDHIDTSDLLLMDFPPEERTRYRLCPGDLLVCEGGEPGRAAIWDGAVDGVYYQKALHRVRPRGISTVRWLYYCLSAATYMNAFAAQGNTTTIAHLTGEQLKAQRLPFPGPAVQECLVEMLDERSRYRRSFRTAVDRQLALLAERRQALITAAVTGQIDVTTARGVDV